MKTLLRTAAILALAVPAAAPLGAQVAPFDVGAKQALLEAPLLPERADLLVQLMQFLRMCAFATYFNGSILAYIHHICRQARRNR